MIRDRRVSNLWFDSFITIDIDIDFNDKLLLLIKRQKFGKIFVHYNL